MGYRPFNGYLNEENDEIARGFLVFLQHVRLPNPVFLVWLVPNMIRTFSRDIPYDITKFWVRIILHEFRVGVPGYHIFRQTYHTYHFNVELYPVIIPLLS